MNHLKSLRDFIEALRAVNDVQEIDHEVDWNLEIGAIIRRSYDLRAPAPLFNNIKGYSEAGLRVLGAPGGLSSNRKTSLDRIALALGLPADSSGHDIIESIVAAHDREMIPPVFVDAASAPCKENIQVGDDIDLFTFPTPLIHGTDGGRYIQTFGMNIAQTPDGSWTNWSVNRMMIFDRNRLACLIPPPQHLGMIRAEWAKLGKPMPIVVALGVEPALPCMGAMPLPENVDESHFLGAYFGEGVEVVKAETVDLPVPATAEIVIEGYVSTSDDDRVMEGPMDEFPGYVSTEASLKPTLHVTAITYRNNAILPVVTAGMPAEEDHTTTGPMHSAEMLYELRRASLPVASVWIAPESASHWLVVSVKNDWHKTFKGDSKELCTQIANTVFDIKAGFFIPKVLVVEEDIDITDINDVVWAFATRAHPSTSELYFPSESFAALAVFLQDNEKFAFHTTKVVHNCLLNDRFSDEERPVKADFAGGWPVDIQQRVLENWTAYGYSKIDG